MPLYDEEDDPTAPPPAVDFAAILQDVPEDEPVPDTSHGAFGGQKSTALPPPPPPLLHADVPLTEATAREAAARLGPLPATVDHHVQGEIPLPPPGRAYDDWGNVGFAPSGGTLPPPPPGSQPAPVTISTGQSGVPYGEPEPDDGFASAVAEALERLAPHSGQSLAPHQIPPPEHDDPESEVTGWVMLAGRNAGKTYAGARWLHRFMSARPNLRARIIAPSFGDAVASCVEGPSGILAASNYQVQWKPAHPGGAQLVWPNGSVCYVIGTPTPRDVDRLRAIGNVDADWFEEAAANPQIAEAERQGRLSRRRKGAKWISTTTPRPLKVIRDWKKDPSVRISAATAHDNKYADPLWLEELERMYKGTRLYAQEVEGKVLEDVEGALWKQEHLERSRIVDIASFYEMLAQEEKRIIRAAVGVDPANSTGTTGIVAAVMTNDRHLYVVEDASAPGRSSDAWARVAVNLALQWDAAIVAENDSGGDAIRGVLKAADLLDEITIMPATARGRGSKRARAEPIALLWERDDFRAHMVGTFPQLEDQMTTFVEGSTTDSPDRMDAMVWALTFLWGRATFEDVRASFPGDSNPAFATMQGRAARAVRPGAMPRWHRRKSRAGRP